MFSISVNSRFACFRVLLLTVYSVFDHYYIPESVFSVSILYRKQCIWLLIYPRLHYLSALGIPLDYEALFPTFPNNIMSNRELTICRLQTITQGKTPPHVWEMENDTKKETLANFLSEKN